MNQWLKTTVGWIWKDYIIPINFFLFSSENIFGYQDLKIDFLISASTLKAFVDINYSKKIDKVTSIYYVSN